MDYLFLYIFSFSILCFLLYIIFTSYDTNNTYDNILLIILIIIQLLFQLSLFIKTNKHLDYLHIIYILSFIFGIFVKNEQIIYLYIFIVIVNLIYWLLSNKCPLGQFDTIPYYNKCKNDLGTNTLNYICYGYMIILIGIYIYKIISNLHIM